MPFPASAEREWMAESWNERKGDQFILFSALSASLQASSIEAAIY